MPVNAQVVLGTLEEELLLLQEALGKMTSLCIDN